MGITSYANLFDRKVSGFNLNLAAAFLVATGLARVVRTVLLSLTAEHFLTAPPRIFLTSFALEIVQAVLFCLLSFRISRNWVLPFVWGLVIALVGPAARGLANAMGPEGFYAGFPFNTYIFGYEYLRGFIFMAGLVLTVRMAQLRMYKFVLGLLVTMVGQIVGCDIYRFIFTLFQGSPNFSLELRIIIQAVLEGLVFGTIFYYTLRLQINRQTFSKTIMALGILLSFGISMGISLANADQTKANFQQATQHANELANRTLCHKQLRVIRMEHGMFFLPMGM